MRKLSDTQKAGIYHLDRIDNAQLKYIYPLAKAFLLPSKLEIFGMVLLEAMYLGAPVITSWNGGSSTLIEGRNTGVIIKEFDAFLWKNAVEKYLNNEAYAHKVVQSAKKLISKEFTWEVIAKKMLEEVKEW